MYHFRLPSGYTDTGGTLHREVELLPLTGKEEELLARFGGNDRTGLLNLVLERSLNCLGNFSPVSRNIIAALSGPDRSFLLWQLQQNTFGDRVQDTVSCTGPGCGKPVDIDFSIQGLIRGILADGDEFADKPELEVHCPECALVFPFLFDIAAFFLKRMQAGVGLLYHEVHVLAYQYHWSENEILSMPREKRKMYLQLLAAEKQRAAGDEDVIVPPAESGPGRDGGEGLWANSIQSLERIQAQSLPHETSPFSPRSYSSSLGQEMGDKETGKEGIAVFEICVPGHVEHVQHVEHVERVEREYHKPQQPQGDINPVDRGDHGDRSNPVAPVELGGQPQRPMIEEPGHFTGGDFDKTLPVEPVESGPGAVSSYPSPVKKIEAGSQLTPQDLPDMLNMPAAKSAQLTQVKPPVTPVNLVTPVKPVRSARPTTPVTQVMPDTPVMPGYLASPAPAASAFWQRMFLGRLHLKFLK